MSLDIEERADRLMQDFYLSKSYDPIAHRPADNVKAAIAFTLASLSTPTSSGGSGDRIAELERERDRAKADYLRIHRDKMELFDRAIAAEAELARVTAEREEKVQVSNTDLIRLAVEIERKTDRIHPANRSDSLAVTLKVTRTLGEFKAIAAALTPARKEQIGEGL